MGSIRGKAHLLPKRTWSNCQCFSGAMDARSGKIQDGSTHFQRCCHGYCSLQSSQFLRHIRHHPAIRESEVKLHGGDGTLRMWVQFAGKLADCQNAHGATVSVLVGRWNVSSVGSIGTKTHSVLQKQRSCGSEQFSGAMDESSGKVRRCKHT